MKKLVGTGPAVVADRDRFAAPNPLGTAAAEILPPPAGQIGRPAVAFRRPSLPSAECKTGCRSCRRFARSAAPTANSAPIPPASSQRQIDPQLVQPTAKLLQRFQTGNSRKGHFPLAPDTRHGFVWRPRKTRNTRKKSKGRDPFPRQMLAEWLPPILPLKDIDFTTWFFSCASCVSWSLSCLFVRT